MIPNPGESCRQDDAQIDPEPGEDEVEVVTERGEVGVGGIIGSALKIPAIGVPFRFHVTITASTAQGRLSARLMAPNMPRLWP